MEVTGEPDSWASAFVCIVYIGREPGRFMYTGDAAS